MNENVLISIVGHHLTDDDENTIETKQLGKYAFFHGKHIIRYEEYPDPEDNTDTPPAAVPCMLKIDPDNVILSKKGAAPVKMHFSPGTAHKTLYQTPLGALPLSIDTSDLKVTEEDGVISVNLSYRLHMNGSPVSECSMSISIVETS